MNLTTEQLLRSEISGQRDRLERCGAEIEKLRAALEPFADVVADPEGSEDFPDDTPVVVKFGRTTHYALKLGDFRRATEASS